MSRSHDRREIPLPPAPQFESFTTFTCDGKQLTREWPESEENENYAHELIIVLDQDECVNFFRRRDLCPSCLDPIWRKISELISADSETERDRDYDDG